MGSDTHFSRAIQQKNRWPNKNNGRGKQGNGGRRRKGGRGDKDDDDDEEQEMEVGTKHEELVYWYTRFEDPNCIAVVELVATVMDTTNGIQVSMFVWEIVPVEARVTTVFQGTTVAFAVCVCAVDSSHTFDYPTVYAF